MNPSRSESKGQAVAATRFAGWFIGLALCWLIILPWLGSQPSMEAHLRWLDERGIDPSAMYYTELDAMKPILSRLNRHK